MPLPEGLAQLELLQLARRRDGQLVAELDAARALGLGTEYPNSKTPEYFEHPSINLFAK